MPTEHIKYEDTLRQGTDKINAAIDQANKAEEDSAEAKNTANEAKSIAETSNQKSDSTQDQLDNIIIESGTSDAETIQARTNKRGVTFDILKDRIDSLDIDLEERGVNVKWFGASGSNQQTTGTITAGSNELTVTDPIDFKVGQGIAITGAGEGGVAEEASLQITSDVTTDGEVIITLDGIATNVPVVAGDTAVQVADKIRETSFDGWTTGGTQGTDIVTFTCNTPGEKQDATYADNGTGATGIMTIVTQGSNGNDLITKIIEINGGLITLETNASTDVSSTPVYHDDTQAIQNAIDHAINLIRTSGTFAEHCSIVFPSGEYLTTGTIFTKPYIKLISNGFVVLKYNGTGTAIRAKLDADEPFFYKEMWNRGSFITGKQGAFVIQNMNDKPTGSIGIDLGDENRNEVDFSRFTVEHIGITGFETGILIRNVNTYLGVFDNIHLEGNRWNVRTYSDGVNATRNSGENFRFINSIFAISEIVIKHETDAFDLVFTNCSFDFNHHVIEFNKGYSSVRFDTCYFEAVHQNIINSLTPPDPIRGNTVFFNNCIIYSKIREYISGGRLTVFVDGFEIRYNTLDEVDASKMNFASADTTNSYRIKNIFFSRDFGQCFSETLNENPHWNFEDKNIGDSLITGTLNGYELINHGDTPTAEITDEISYSGTKSLKIVSNSGYIAFRLSDPIQSSSFENWLLGFRFAQNTTGVLRIKLRIDALDENGNLIKSSGDFHPDRSADTSLTWAFTEYIRQYTTPPGTNSINFFIEVSGFEGTVYIDDIILNKA